MSENETKNESTGTETVNTQTPEAPKSETSHSVAESAAEGKSKTGMYVGAVLIVIATLLVVLFMLEKEGGPSTGIFDSYFASQENNAIVAIVNNEEITGKDLNTSIQQFNQAALAQGVDPTNPEVVADILAQSLEVLVNTALLKQAANDRGIEVTNEAAAERLEVIEAEVGGPDVLQERINELGLTRSDLEQDIKEEILIQTLLNGIFAEAEIEVTEEEIAGVYSAAGGVEAGLPPLEEVREQIEAQVRGSKEQEVIDAYLDTLKVDAEIELI